MRRRRHSLNLLPPLPDPATRGRGLRLPLGSDRTPSIRLHIATSRGGGGAGAASSWRGALLGETSRGGPLGGEGSAAGLGEPRSSCQEVSSWEEGRRDRRSTAGRGGEGHRAGRTEISKEARRREGRIVA